MESSVTFISPWVFPRQRKELHMSSTQDQVIAIITSVCHPNKPDLSDTSKPLLECGLDSLDFASVLIEIEDKFGVEMPSQDKLDQINSINALVALIAGKKA
jgi:acyl carrier protein